MIDAIAPHPYLITGARALVPRVGAPSQPQTFAGSVNRELVAVSKDPSFLDRMAEAVVRYGSPSAARRVGLVVERFFGPAAALPYRELIGQNRSPVLMWPGGPADGPLDKTWRVIVNAELQPEKVLA